MSELEANLRLALANERKAHRETKKENAGLRKYRAKYFEARDMRELWESRAIRYSNKLNAQKIHDTPAGRK